eukprot:SAG11_NODE_148_length_14747_cov_217.933517_23_plen_127_part_00
MTLRRVDQLIINNMEINRMSEFKHKPNTGSMFYQQDSLDTSKPTWKGKILLDDDVLKMLIDDRKTTKEAPVLNIGGWQENDKARISLKVSTWKPEKREDKGFDKLEQTLSNADDKNNKYNDEIPWD